MFWSCFFGRSEGKGRKGKSERSLKIGHRINIYNSMESNHLQFRTEWVGIQNAQAYSKLAPEGKTLVTKETVRSPHYPMKFRNVSISHTSECVLERKSIGRQEVIATLASHVSGNSFSPVMKQGIPFNSLLNFFLEKKFRKILLFKL
jgi:hypothetical protein